MMTDVTANRVKPVGPVLGSLRAYLTEGKPPGGGPSWRTGMSLMDCTAHGPQIVCQMHVATTTNKLDMQLDV